MRMSPLSCVKVKGGRWHAQAAGSQPWHDLGHRKASLLLSLAPPHAGSQHTMPASRGLQLRLASARSQVCAAQASPRTEHGASGRVSSLSPAQRVVLMGDCAHAVLPNLVRLVVPRPHIELPCVSGRCSVTAQPSADSLHDSATCAVQTQDVAAAVKLAKPRPVSCSTSCSLVTRARPSCLTCSGASLPACLRLLADSARPAQGQGCSSGLQDAQELAEVCSPWRHTSAVHPCTASAAAAARPSAWDTSTVMALPLQQAQQATNNMEPQRAQSTTSSGGSLRLHAGSCLKEVPDWTRRSWMLRAGCCWLRP